MSGYLWGSPPAILTGSPAALTFAARAGTSSPAPKTPTVAEELGRSFAITASDDAPWLSVSPARGVVEDELHVTVDTADLAAGVHRATVRIDSGGGSPVLVPVTLTLEPAPPASPPPAPPVAPASPPAGPVAA